MTFAVIVFLSWPYDGPSGRILDSLLNSFTVMFSIGKMAEQIGKTKPVVSFEYELFEGDPDHLRTVVATPTPDGPWIEPASLKLKYRIGRGPFGDVRLATHHQSSHDFDEYHELALKVLHPLEKDHMQKFLDKFEELFFKSRGFHNVCWLHGISIIDGKVCLENKLDAVV